MLRQPADGSYMCCAAVAGPRRQ